MFSKYFSSILAFVMVLSLLSPFSAFANEQETLPFKGTQESNLELKAAIAEQLALANGGPKLHEALQNVSGSEEVSIIVHLSENPVALEKGIATLAGKSFSAAEANKAEKKVITQQEKVLNDLKKKSVKLEQGFTYNTVLNGFSATIKASDLSTLLEVEGVTLVEPDVIVSAFEDNTEEGTEDESTEEVPNEKATEEGTEEVSEEAIVPDDENDQVETAMSTSIDFLGIEKLWAEGLEGQGIKVAVLDTGIDADHPEFAGIYKGGKNFVTHSSQYNRQRAEDDASETSPAERAPDAPEVNASGRTFHTDHGTHVAGTIAAIGANNYGIKGIAPKVDLYAYRVLGAYGSGATAGIIAAIEESVKEDMDVINLSLGGGANTETSSNSFAINNAMMAGVISVVATGNSGPNRGTMGTPSTARLGIAVGNTTNPEAQYTAKINVTAGEYKYSKAASLMRTNFGKSLSDQLKGEFDIVAIPGLGEVKDFEGIDVEGKVALISRGTIAFDEKIENAKANGAIAAIIHNNTGTAPANIVLGDSFEFIPTFDISLPDGNALREAIAVGEAKVSFNDFNMTMTAGDEVNDSSSRGPSTPNFDIKPDVSAPGTNIMSSIPRYKADYPDAVYDTAYERFTGTSMATPHIAGIAALIKQANPEWTPFDVKVALSNTAKILDTAKYDVFSQGAGRVEAYAAAFPEVLAYAKDTAILDASGEVVENLKGTVTFGPQSLKDGAISVTKEILVKDMQGKGGEYKVDVQVTKDYEGAKVTVDKSSFTLNGEQLIKVTLTAPQKTTKAGDEILGYIKIEKDGKGVSLPFAADFSDVPPIEVRNLAISETDLSFNGDGVKDTARLSFVTTGTIAPIYIELWDIQNPDGGAYEDGYIGYILAQNSLGAGSWSLNITGRYTPWDGTPATTIPDGLYTVDLNGESATGPIAEYVGPVVVKTTKPEISGVFNENNVVGKVTDKYIDYNDVLADYGLDYELNTKLFASYVISKDGVEEAPVSFELEEDGSFVIPVAGFNKETDSLKVIVKDVAGNSNEQEILSSVSLDVSKEITVTTQAEAQIKVNYVTSLFSGETTEEDVAKLATYTVADEEVISVTEGKVTPKSVGQTEVTVEYNGLTAKVLVKVVAPSVPGPGPSPTPSTPAPSPSTPAEPTPSVPVFSDIQEHWAASYIQKAAALGMIKGYEDGTFKPNAGLTRSQAVSLIVRGLGLTTDEAAPFTDISKYAAETQAEIAAAYKYGIVKGNDGAFRPSDKVTRAQLALMIQRAYEAKTGKKYEVTNQAPFSDFGGYDQETINAISMLHELKIVDGNNGQFLPTQPTTRAHIAKMLVNFIEGLEK